MKTGGGLFGKYENQKLGCGSVAKCLLFAVVILTVLNPAVLPTSFFPSNWTTNEPVTIEQRKSFDFSSSDHTGHALRLDAKTKPQKEDGTGTTGSEVWVSASNSTQQQEITELQNPVEYQSVTRIDVSITPATQETFEQTEREPVKKIEIPPNKKMDNKEHESSVEKEHPSGSDAPAQSAETKQSREMSPSMSFNKIEKPGENNSRIESDEKQSTPAKEKTEEASPTTSVTEITENKSKLVYNSESPRYNICSIEGDIRIVPNAPNASTIFVVSPTPLDPNTTTWKIVPFPRKWESHTMEGITEITIQQLTDANQARSCDVTHNLPAVVFSTARFTQNLFHAYTDMIYPIFLATHRYHGEVKLVVEDYFLKYIEKYQVYLRRLSNYPIINLDNETRVHCFSSVQVGLENPGPLGYKSQNPRNDQAMQQFTQFVRESLSLERSEVERGKKPRLLILLRKNTRSIINEDEVINLAKDVGFEIVTADVQTTTDFPRIAHIVNSCDVLMGIHGAGLANMLYLPKNGTVLQIIPFGYLIWVGRFDYGDPTKGFGLRYVEYEITLDESNLKEKYPRDHIALTNPLEIHKKGWQMIYETYLYQQNVKLDVNRFRGTLEELFKLYQ